MKKRVSGFIIGLFLIAGLTQSGYAASWIFDTTADGDQSDALAIIEWIDITSTNLVLGNADPAVAGSFSFNNSGTVSAVKVDNSTTEIDELFKIWQLGAYYSFTGTGDTQEGSIAFDPGGTLTLTVGSVDVATLTVISGSGSIDSEAVSNGDITISYSLEVLAENYLFWEDGTAMTNAIAYTTTNANRITNETLKTALLEKQGVTQDQADSYDIVFYLSSNGQFRLEPVPVPTAFLLLGSGLIGLVGFRRKIG
ncbi:PEP-CTERM sorting domain-containing protein [uncultured Desulfobacter sp.]|uniref:PEP-CTERM sorting domain-containing protein n=1 Tax=uncultured Desulfobacter sp. TaxID=240139 RepID=UPI002AA712FA|nr:PEP-CTERM sorting domain-containing protein [uncultured Desulfobacter sp.]